MNFYLYSNASTRQTLFKNSPHTKKLVEYINTLKCSDVDPQDRMSAKIFFESTGNTVSNNQIINVNLDDMTVIFTDVCHEPIIYILIAVGIILICIIIWAIFGNN